METATETDLRFLPEGLKQGVLEAFGRLASGQLGLPERLGTSTAANPGLFHATGLLTYCAEHVGDLTHRMSERGCENTSFGYGPCSEKVRRALRYMRSSYGFAREVDLNIRNNHGVAMERDEGFMDLDAYQAELRRAALRYGDAHRSLPVWNRPQFHAREAAVALGEMDFASAETHLAELESLLFSRASWVIACATAWLGSDGDPVPYAPGMKEPSFVPAGSTETPRRSGHAMLAARALAEWNLVRPVADGEPLDMVFARLEDGSVAGLSGAVTARSLAEDAEAREVSFEFVDDRTGWEGLDAEEKRQALECLSSADEGPFSGLVASAAARALSTARAFPDEAAMPLPRP